MTNGSVLHRLAAPARLAAKEARHLAMRSRRLRKRVVEWPGWRAAGENASAAMERLRAVRLPLHHVPSETRHCPACGGTALRLLEPISLYHTVDGTRTGFATGCEGCGLLFVNPPPDSETLKAFYSPEGTWGVSHERRNDALERQAQRALAGYRKPNQRRRARHVLLEAIDTVTPIFTPPPQAAALDFGCGDGKLLNGLLEEGWETYGIEPSTDVAFLRHQRLDELPSEPSFDLVILHHVLEHVSEPLDLLRKLSSAMRPGGALFISVPRLDTLPQHGDFRYCLNGRTHVVSFTEDCLRNLLARAGLEMVATLSDPSLDAQLSDGKPLRLRVVAIKSGKVPAPGARPLEAARRALAAYRRQHPATRSWVESLLPVRARAYWMDRGIA
jgi:2-polyprenyl-3-methyl-5-hydroxy-6-metoxy-1,4-benzoquinol methylase